MNSLTLKRVQARLVGACTVSAKAVSAGVTGLVRHFLYYLLSGGSHYITSDGKYYQCKES